MNSPTPSDDAPLLDAQRSIDAAPLPTASTLRQRKNLVFQTIRFASLNAKILRMVLKGHR
jgi:hypothetical protein